MIGQVISHYKILEKLGEGGMGVVYKAHDTKLDRTVALKFLPVRHAGDESERARFLLEARAASALNHPNVCHINAIEEADGQQFIDMEYVDGGTLRQQIPFHKINDAVTFAVQIGEALHEAHTHGIVHRDIKCDNIMVNSRNQIKVMDFGLAKLKGALKLTRTSSTVGTLGYMAPEQIQGGEVDARSDIFSFGVVVFEILTGRLPFKGEHEAAMIYSIINEQPESAQKYHQDISADLDRIMHRALEKDPEDRYQHIDDMVSELRRVQKQSTRVSRSSLTNMPAHPSDAMVTERHATNHVGSGRTRIIVLSGVILAVLAAGVIWYTSFFSKQESIDSIAVLPFDNVGADPNTEYLSDGITESLISTLSQLSNLSVKSRSSVFHYKGKDIDPQKAGKELGVKAILTGRVAQRGEGLQISTELVDVSTNNQIWGAQYNKKLAEILSVQEVISKEISQKLSLKLGGDDEKKLTKHSTESTEAYQLYLKGRFYWSKRTAEDLLRAGKYFHMALEKDENFALASAGLASTYVILPEYAGVSPSDFMPKAAVAAQKASELDPTLAEPHAVLGLIKYGYEWDWEGSEKEFKRAIELNPNYPTTHHWYNICLAYQGKFDEAMAEIKRAQELDPLSLIISINVADVYMYLRQYDHAIEQYKKALELDPNFPPAHMGLGLVYAIRGKSEDAINEMQKLADVVGRNSLFGLEGLGYAYSLAGRKEEAAKVIHQLLDLAKQGDAVSVQLASMYAALDEKDKAFEWLEKGYEEHHSLLGGLKVLPSWDTLRSDPRYHALLKKIGLEK